MWGSHEGQVPLSLRDAGRGCTEKLQEGSFQKAWKCTSVMLDWLVPWVCMNKICKLLFQPRGTGSQIIFRVEENMIPKVKGVLVKSQGGLQMWTSSEFKRIQEETGADQLSWPKDSTWLKLDELIIVLSTLPSKGTTNNYSSPQGDL